MNYTKKVISTLALSGFVFLGCAGTETKPAPKSELKAEPKKELTAQEVKYNKVVEKTINECKEHGIELNHERTEKFVGRFTPADIDKIITITKKLPKRNCELFADETSLEKVEKVKVAVKKTVDECKALGVDLDAKAVENHIMKIPLFVIKKVLEANRPSTKEDCSKMASILK